MKPIIGITPSAQLDTLAHGTFLRYCMSAPYVRAVEDRRGRSSHSCRHSAILIDELMAVIDGLLLEWRAGRGSGAVRRQLHPPRDVWHRPRSRSIRNRSLRLLRCNRGIPVFGICRGIQVMNVALGGTLIQDVSTEHPGAADVGHRQHERGLEDWAVGHENVRGRP